MLFESRHLKLLFFVMTSQESCDFAKTASDVKLKFDNFVYKVGDAISNLSVRFLINTTIPR